MGVELFHITFITNLFLGLLKYNAFVDDYYYK